MIVLEAFRAAVSEFRRLASIRARFPTATFERGVVVKGDLDNLKLGEKVVVQSGSVIHLGGMPWAKETGSLSIGSDSVISPLCVIYAAGPGGVRIGSRFDCGPGVKIFASRTDFDAADNSHVFGAVEIGDDVVVFANSVVGPGITIGDGAVIAAGSVVLDHVAANTVVGGAPARFLRAVKGDSDGT